MNKKQILLIVLAVLLAASIFLNGWLMYEKFSNPSPENWDRLWGPCGNCHDPERKGPDYYVDEAKSPFGPNRCDTSCCCDGERICSGGWCWGTAR